jgi:hypothetical protein
MAPSLEVYTLKLASISAIERCEDLFKFDTTASLCISAVGYVKSNEHVDYYTI